MFNWHLIGGNGHKTGHACLGREQVVPGGILRMRRRVITNGEQFSFFIKQKAEIHPLRHHIGAFGQVVEAQIDARLLQRDQISRQVAAICR